MVMAAWPQAAAHLAPAMREKLLEQGGKREEHALLRVHAQDHQQHASDHIHALEQAAAWVMAVHVGLQVCVCGGGGGSYV